MSKPKVDNLEAPGPFRISVDSQIQDAFENPEKYDWTPPDRVESALMDCIEKGDIVLAPWTLYDRERMHKIVDMNKRESIQFQCLPNGVGLRMRVVQ